MLASPGKHDLGVGTRVAVGNVKVEVVSCELVYSLSLAFDASQCVQSVVESVSFWVRVGTVARGSKCDVCVFINGMVAYSIFGAGCELFLELAVN